MELARVVVDLAQFLRSGRRLINGPVVAGSTASATIWPNISLRGNRSLEIGGGNSPPSKGRIAFATSRELGGRLAVDEISDQLVMPVVIGRAHVIDVARRERGVPFLNTLEWSGCRAEQCAGFKVGQPITQIADKVRRHGRARLTACTRLPIGQSSACFPAADCGPGSTPDRLARRPRSSSFGSAGSRATKNANASVRLSASLRVLAKLWPLARSAREPSLIDLFLQPQAELGPVAPGGAT